MKTWNFAGLIARVAHRPQAANRVTRSAAGIEDMLRRRPLELSTDRC